MPKRKYRKIHINNQVWKYWVGKGNVVIYSPNNTKYVKSFSTITGWSWTDIEHDNWKRNFHLVPNIIKWYIVHHILTKYDS